MLAREARSLTREDGWRIGERRHEQGLNIQRRDASERESLLAPHVVVYRHFPNALLLRLPAYEQRRSAVGQIT